MPSYGGKQYPGAPPLLRGPPGGAHPYDHFSRPSSIQVRREAVAARRVFRLRSYRDGQLFRFEVPADTRIAVWKFVTNRTRGDDNGGVRSGRSGKRHGVVGGGGDGITGTDAGSICRPGTVSV